MRRFNKRKLILTLTILVIIALIFAKVFIDSRANKVINIDVKFIDSDKLLEDENLTLETSDEDYSIILPEYINGKRVAKYIVKNESIIQEETDKAIENEVGESNLKENTNSYTNVQKATNSEKSATDVQISETENDNNAELSANQRLYLTQKEREDKKVEIEVKYDTIEKNGKKLYKKQIKQEVAETNETSTVENAENSLLTTNESIKNDSNTTESKTDSSGNNTVNDANLTTNVTNGTENVTGGNQTNLNEQNAKKNIITIEGYMPADSEVKVAVINDEKENKIALEHGSENAKIEFIYDIKIISGGKEYEPTDFDESTSVTIEGVENLQDANKKYKVVHIDKDKKGQEVKNVVETDNSIQFSTDSFSEYAILSDTSTESASETTNAGGTTNTAGTNNGTATKKPNSVPIRRAASITADKSLVKWDGTVGTQYAYGDGTQSSPYLISDGKELAYLQTQVNNGNSYNGTYFSLVSNIDLGGNEWTPIGNSDTAFSGVFDGSGFMITNAVINTASSMTVGNTYCYGLFGIVGNGNQRCEIKNLEVSNFTMKFNLSGNSPSGWWGDDEAKVNMGIVVGRMLNKSSLTNVIAKNSTISSANNFTIRSDFQLFVGGLVGQATNTNSSDSGMYNTIYSYINNCLSDVDFSFNNVSLYNSRNGRATYAKEFAVGGIIGVIQAQQVWPENSLYTGTINATYAFTGPIFAYLSNNAYLDYGTGNFDTVWQGNNAGGNLTMTSYYTGYSTNNRTFTSTYTSGTTPSSTTYRIRSSSSSNNMQYWQGMNKGIYTSDYSSMISKFNSYATSNSGLLSWKYENNNYSLIPRFEVTINDVNAPNYVAVVKNNYEDTTYTYKWYVDEVDQNNNTNKISVASGWEKESSVRVIVSDGTYYAINNFKVPKLEVHITFDVTNTSVVGAIEGTGLQDPNLNLNDYTYQWYKVGVDGDPEIIDGETTDTLLKTNMSDEYDYKLIATNTKYSYMSAEGLYNNANRIVVFVDAANGSDYNDGYTETTAKKTMAGAYSLFETTTTRNTNVIVLMGTYYTESNSGWRRIQ